MKFTDEQKEVLELLPTNVKETNELTDAAKLILANLMYLNGTDFAKNEGYLFRTNQALMQDTGIKSEKTIIAAVNKLIEFGFIERKAGQRKSASEYRLNTVKMNEYTVKIHCKNENYSNKLQYKNYSNKLQYKEKNTVINYSNDNNETTLIINGLQETIKKLQDKITVMSDELLQYKNYSIKNYSENKNYSTDIDIDKEIETISKDNLLDNNNTEGRNSKEKNNIKEKSTKDNLEILKENSTVEIPNDEDIQRENESLDEIENTSKDKLLDNGNLNESRIPSESRIETRDNISTVNISDNGNLNESRISDLVHMYFNQTNIPNDMPPLDVDCFFENNFNQPTEYRTNGNFNESRIPSESRIETKDNISDNENSKANEIDCSVFGNETFDSDTISKTQNLVPRCVDGRFVVVEDNISNDENSKNNNLKTSENMKMTNNKTNTIPSEGKNPSDEKTLKNLNAFGKLQSFRDLKTGRIDGYQFNSYDNLNDSRDYSKSFHASVLCLNLEPSDLKKVSASDTGTWGILNRTNGVYSFIPSNVGPSYAPNNALQDDKMTEVDNHTTNEEITAGNSVKMRPEASDSNTNPTDTPNNGTQAPKTADVDNHTTNTEKVDSTQSQNTNKASNAYADALEDDAETIAIRERVMRQNTARAQQTEKKSDDKTPKDFDYYKRTPDGWKEIPVHITMENKKMTMGEALELYKNFDNPLVYLYSIMRYVQDFCEKMKCASRLKAITDEQYEAFKNELNEISAGYKAYWKKRFSYQKPDPNSSAEQDMHRWLGHPKVTQDKN